MAAAAAEGSVLAGELAGVTAAIAEELAPLLRGGEGGARLSVPEGARAYVVAALAASHDGPVLAVAPTALAAQTLAEDLELLSDGPVVRMPQRDALPYEFVRDDPSAGVERGRALRALAGGERVTVVASWAAVTEYVAPPAPEAEDLSLEVGRPARPGDVVAWLEGAGYVVEPLADAPGRVARRGGLIDVFPAGFEHPVRVEFFGDVVESIRVVDLATQRSKGRVERVLIPPVATSLGAGRAAARELAKRLVARGEGAEAVVEEVEAVAAGGRTAFHQFLEPLLFRSTALDHLGPKALVAVIDPEEGVRALEQAQEYERRARAEQEERGAIPSGLPDLRPEPELAAGALVARADVVLERFGSAERGVRELALGAAPGFGGRLRVVAQQVEAWRREGRRVAVASLQALRLADVFEKEGVVCSKSRTLSSALAAGSVALVPAALSSGVVTALGTVVLADAEIFGFRKRRRPMRAVHGVRADLVASLEVGDFVVHADHGIARYGGLVRRAVDGVEREYLELQYAEGDRLYVPADQLEAISRYVGPSDHPPALTRLGTQDWARSKRRVKQAVVEMAHDLLELYARRQLVRGHAFREDTPWQLEMEASFPFVETNDQLAAIAEVKADMERPRPMDRLICGDVGYGKTEVAVRAAFKAVMDGKQVAVLVPTTVLAEQHGETFRERMAGFPVRVEVLSRFRSVEEQRRILRDLAAGEVDIVVGTHRLLQRDVVFKDLGLVVIDEEQRFGVSHKERLRQMRAEVDTLTLSATPIPRTLQMSLVGIRDMSTIMTPPEERQPIRTYVMTWDDEILREAIERELQRGGQVFFVHNRVQDIERVARRVMALVPEADVAIGHGQMPEEQLERVMLEFQAGEHDVLVCTTIIESGLDIPNANTIIIDEAHRLGLAQLYQLRGRVGRSANRAYAYLLYDRDRPLSEVAQKRLEAIFEATELGAGFQLALRDLEIRGAGNVLGTEQSGHIAEVGFELYTKLVGEAVAALKRGMGEEVGAAVVSEPPPPVIDLPLSAHIPESYVGDVHARLNLYQRMAQLESPEAVAEMRDELRDRFGPLPLAVENLLFVALVRNLARRAGVEAIKTDEQMFHLYVRGGTTPELRARVERLGLRTLVLVGPKQVRVDRVGAGEGWMPLLVRILRAMAVGRTGGEGAEG
ncbi:transcription-repair coupling factor [Tepidiforma sp.]|uniref:transcription-repair coupling factor n=1 Tax=Tepidiforma sp. TaxID=2682230 RepID=UPI002ADD9819|nr:transcription-repair coupling factor [Tepidiforma sp.]